MQGASSARSTPWNPTTFLRFEEAYDTSMGTARIVTDAGPAYIKPLGNRQGPHPLACEWVATHLARWFGPPTFEIALIQIDADVDEIPFHRGGYAASGTAFVARAFVGHSWGGSGEELDKLVNPEAVSDLVGPGAGDARPGRVRCASQLFSPPQHLRIGAIPVRMPWSPRRNLGMLLLAVWLIITGLAGLIPQFNFQGMAMVLGIIALAAGVLILMGR